MTDNNNTFLFNPDMSDITSLTTRQKQKFHDLVEATREVITDLPNATTSDQRIYLDAALDCFIGLENELYRFQPVRMLRAQLKQLAKTN